MSVKRKIHDLILFNLRNLRFSAGKHSEQFHIISRRLRRERRFDMSVKRKIHDLILFNLRNLRFSAGKHSEQFDIIPADYGENADLI